MKNKWEKCTIEQVKQIQIQILQYVHKFCMDNDISYWLDSGTLLGAIRHQGYIPWDDDIDIGMLRPDYNRFMDAFNKTDSQYKFYCIENNSKFLYPHGKVIDTKTLLYEPDENGNKLSINIDVFVYDNAPNNDKKVKKMYNRRDRYRRLMDLVGSHHKPRGNILRRICINFVRMVLKIIPKKIWCKKIINNSKKYQDKNASRVGNFTAYTRMICDKQVFDEFIDVTFEGELYKAPIGYDKWLTAFYGDYMKLPPPEKRVSHHKFIAYVTQ